MVDSVSQQTIPRILFPARLVHETPFETRGETSAATTTETRVLDGLDDPGVTLEEDLFCAMPVAARLTQVGRILSPRRNGIEMGTHLGTLETVIVPAVGVCEDSVLVLETSVTPDWRVMYCREGTSERPGGLKLRARE